MYLTQAMAEHVRNFISLLAEVWWFSPTTPCFFYHPKTDHFNRAKHHHSTPIYSRIERTYYLMWLIPILCDLFPSQEYHYSTVTLLKFQSTSYLSTSIQNINVTNSRMVVLLQLPVTLPKIFFYFKTTCAKQMQYLIKLK